MSRQVQGQEAQIEKMADNLPPLFVSILKTCTCYCLVLFKEHLSHTYTLIIHTRHLYLVSNAHVVSLQSTSVISMEAESLRGRYASRELAEMEE